MATEARDEGHVNGLVKRVRADVRTAVSSSASAPQRAAAVGRTVAVGAGGIVGAGALGEGIHALALQNPGVVHALTTGAPGLALSDFAVVGASVAVMAGVSRAVGTDQTRARMGTSFRRVGTALLVGGAIAGSAAGIVGGAESLGLIHNAAHVAPVVGTMAAGWGAIGAAELMGARLIRPRRTALPESPAALGE